MIILGHVRITDQKLEEIEFLDRNGQKCTLQASSLSRDPVYGTSAVWLGRKLEPAHLDRVQVEALIGHLQAWLDRGSFATNEVKKL